MITLTAFRQVPDFAKGLVRDLRVRWALEEAGIPYEARLIRFEDLADPAYRALQPFGQVPAIQVSGGAEDGFTLFESGAIVLWIAERCPALMPSDAGGRAKTQAWVCAALNSVEPAVQALGEIDLFHAAEPWAEKRRPIVAERVEKRLDALAAQLQGRDYLLDRFTAGDLMMVTVLRILRHTELVAERPALHTYQLRCEARPAFRKALDDHSQPFAAAA
jgi:glutathione S-transferase